MWLLSGPFDGDISTEVSTHGKKIKLLKTDSAYTLGRKDRALCVASKKISHEHCQFSVGSFPSDCVSDSTFIPELRFLNKKDKIIKIGRGGSTILANPLCTQTLQDGDVLAVVSGIHITVQWLPICCYVSAHEGLFSDLESFTSIGINIVHHPSANVTHHVLQSHTANMNVIASMISASQLVGPGWLSELMKRGSAEGGQRSPFEESFELPSAHQFRPTFDPCLPKELCDAAIWEPNEERCSIFRQFAFLILGESTALDPDLHDVIELGGGDVTYFNSTEPGHPLKTWARDYSTKDKVVLVAADPKSVRRVLQQNHWSELLEDVQSHQIPLYPSSILIDVVVQVNVDLLRKPWGCFPVDRIDSSVTSCAPHSSIQEASSSSRSNQGHIPEVFSNNLDAPPEPPRLRKALKRRVNDDGIAVRTGIDDPSILDEMPSMMLGFSQAAVQSNAAPAARSSRRLKRRAGLEPEPELEITTQAEHQEPPLKKLKPFYETTDPDNDPSQATPILDVTSLLGTNTQLSETPGGLAESAPPAENGIQSLFSTLKPLKRRAEALDDEVSNGDQSNHKRLITEEMRTSEQGKVDEGRQFLKAPTSKKRSKQTEDDFDREFNDLRIARPDLHQRKPDDGWAHFEDENDARGNFMVIIDIELPLRPVRNGATSSSTWDGKPNFKKFKKKTTDHVSRSVDLFPSQVNDYGIGDSYWKSSHSQNERSAPRARSKPMDDPPSNPTIGVSEDRKNRNTAAADGGKKPAATSRSNTASRSNQRLFLDSDDDAATDQMQVKQTSTKTDSKRARAPTAKANSKKVGLYIDDESDEEIVFRGSRKRNMR